jgi:hypothetical protein
VAVAADKAHQLQHQQHQQPPKRFLWKSSEKFRVLPYKRRCKVRQAVSRKVENGGKVVSPSEKKKRWKRRAGGRAGE